MRNDPPSHLLSTNVRFPIIGFITTYVHDVGSEIVNNVHASKTIIKSHVHWWNIWERILLYILRKYINSTAAEQEENFVNTVYIFGQA